MDILNFHRKVIEEIQSLRHEQAETNKLLRLLIPHSKHNMTVTFDGEEHFMSTTSVTPTDTTQVGLITVGVPAETETNTSTGVTTAYQFDPSKIVWTIVDNTVASFTVDATTGQATFTALKAGNTTGTVTDSATGATTTYDVVVTAVTPDSFAITVAFQPKTS